MATLESISQELDDIRKELMTDKPQGLVVAGSQSIATVTNGTDSTHFFLQPQYYYTLDIIANIGASASANSNLYINVVTDENLSQPMIIPIDKSIQLYNFRIDGVKASEIWLHNASGNSASLYITFLGYRNPRQVAIDQKKLT